MYKLVIKIYEHLISRSIIRKLKQYPQKQQHTILHKPKQQSKINE